jgi:hypothetical protein
MSQKEYFKVTLSSGKTALLRKIEIRMLKMAEKAAGGTSGMEYMSELLKLVLVKIDDKKITPIQLESMDDILDVTDFVQLAGVLGKSLETAAEAPKIEMVFGEQ